MKRKKNYKYNSPNRPSWKLGPKPIKKAIKHENVNDEDLDELSLKKTFLGTTTPRLLAAAKEFNIGKEGLLTFLKSKGFTVEGTRPTQKLSTRMYVELIKEFNPEKLKELGLDETSSIALDEEFITLSIINGKFVVRKQNSDGSVVIAEGMELKHGIFFPFFSSSTAAVTELEDLINDPKVSEDELQKFLERNPEFILDDDFCDAIPQARIVTEETSWEADFILIPHNQVEFSKILELKLPQEKTFNKEQNGHMRLSAKLYHAIQQLKDYNKAFNSKDTRDLFHKRYGANVYRPDMQLIIGRKGDFHVKKSFIDQQKDEGIKIQDWDTFLEKQKRKFC